MIADFCREHRLLIKCVTPVLMLGASIYILDWEVVGTTVSAIDPWHFVFATLLLVPIHVILGWRWFLIVRGNVNLPFLYHLRRFLISVFLVMFAPGSVGGDIYRYFALKSGSTDRWLLVGAIARERIIGIAGVSIFFLLCYAFLWGFGILQALTANQPVNVAAILLLIGLIALIPAKMVIERTLRSDVLKSRPVIANILRLTSHGLDLGSVRWIAGMTAISLVVCGLWAGCIFITSINLDVLPLGPWELFLVFGVVGILTELVRIVPITFQGLGIREWAFAYFLTGYGADFDVAFVLGAASYLGMSISFIIAGLIGSALPNENSRD